VYSIEVDGYTILPVIEMNWFQTAFILGRGIRHNSG